MSTRLTTVCAAVALVTLSGAAMAQSTFTPYGRANLSVESQKIGNVSGSAMVDNSSRIGMRIGHAVDAEISVGATLEAGTNWTTGSVGSTMFAREATMHVAGSFGKVRLGKMPGSAAYFATADYISNHNHDTGSSSDALWDSPAVGQLARAVGYTSPKLGDLTLEAQYGLKNGTDGNGTTTTAVSPVSLAANYGMGPLQFGLGYETGANSFTTGNTTDSMNATTLRANYTMGPLLLAAYLQKTSGTLADRTASRLAAMYTVGKNEYHANFGMAGDRDGVSNTGATQFTLAYNFNVDKQFKLYAFYTTISNDTGALYTGSRFISTTPAAGNGDNLRSLAIGARYNF